MFIQTVRRALAAAVVALSLASSMVPTASATTNYTFTITKIECIVKQDSLINGSDEPRIILNGITMYMGSGFSNGTVKGVNLALSVQSTATLDVWEVDPSPDPDDFIGSKQITSSAAAGLGELSVTVGNSKGKYKIFYEVN